MCAIGILICFLIVVILSFILGAILKDNNDFLSSLLAGFIIIMVVFTTLYTDAQNEKLEKYGTYPDTTITIKNGVRDTSITYKVYEEKNN